MNTDSLKYFMAIASGSTYLEASDNFNISQSSISKAIKQIENELGVELFDRSRRSVTLTEAGKKLYDDLIPLELSYQKMLAHMRAFSAKKQMKVAIPKMGSSVFIKRIIESYNVLHPATYVNLTEINTHNHEELVSLLTSNEYDFAIMHKPLVRNTELVTCMLQDDCLMAVFPKAEDEISNIETRRSISLADACGQTVYVEKGHSMSYMLPVICRLKGIRLHIVEIPDWLSVIGNVAEGEGMTFAFKESLNIINMEYMNAYLVNDIPNIPLVLAYSKERPLLENHLLLKDYLIRHIQERPIIR